MGFMHLISGTGFCIPEIKHSFQKWLLRGSMIAHLIRAEVLVAYLYQLKVAECKHSFGVPHYELCVSRHTGRC